MWRRLGVAASPWGRSLLSPARGRWAALPPHRVPATVSPHTRQPCSVAACMSSSPKKRARRRAAAAAGVDLATVPALRRRVANGADGNAVPAGNHQRYGHFTVALVGRPNVGKSSLFNRLVGSRLAIVNTAPGTTRDWKEEEAYLAGLCFTAVDTGGLDERQDDDVLDGKMLSYTADVLATADVALYLVDARTGVTAEDEHFAKWVKKHRSGPTAVIANKAEALMSSTDDQELWDALCADVAKLGLGEPHPVSAEHGEGMGNLFEVLQPFGIAAGVDLEPLAADDADTAPGDAADKDVCLAIVGRPNVGKSTLLNKMLQEDRVMTGPQPGVTRDSVKVQWSFRGRTVHLVDTAGIRRLGMWDPDNPLESLAVASAKKALGVAHVVALVLDAQEGLTRQDMSIAQAVLDEGRALVVVLNKTDHMSQITAGANALARRLQSAVAGAKGTPVIPTSALHGAGVGRLMPAVMDVFSSWNFRVSTGKLNRWLARLCRHHPPPSAFQHTRRRISGVSKPVPVSVPLKLKYMVQVKGRPPTFALFANRTSIPDNYHRFLVASLREEFGLHGVPIRLVVRSAKNPYATKGLAGSGGSS